MSLPRAGVRSDFRRFEELEYYFNEAKDELIELTATLQTQINEKTATLQTQINERTATLQTQINERSQYGVVTGLATTAQTTPDMSVNVSSGVIYMQNGDRFEVDTDVITVDTADTTNARKDIIYVNSTGKITYLAGTAAEASEAPSTPTGGLILAEIAVAANAIKIEKANITDKRKLIVS